MGVHTILQNSWSWPPLVEFGFWLVGLLDVFAFLCLTDMVIDFDLFYFLLLTFCFLSMWFLFGLNWHQNKWMHLKRVFFLSFFTSESKTSWRSYFSWKRSVKKVG